MNHQSYITRSNVHKTSLPCITWLWNSYLGMNFLLGPRPGCNVHLLIQKIPLFLFKGRLYFQNLWTIGNYIILILDLELRINFFLARNYRMMNCTYYVMRWLLLYFLKFGNDKDIFIRFRIFIVFLKKCDTMCPTGKINLRHLNCIKKKRWQHLSTLICMDSSENRSFTLVFFNVGKKTKKNIFGYRKRWGWKLN